MDVWSLGWSDAASDIEGVHRCLRLSHEPVSGASVPVLDLSGGSDEASSAVHVHIASESDQHAALAHIGLAEWVVLTFADWSMIPVENLVAAAQSTPTKIAAVVDTPSAIAGAAFALQTGVDAVAVPPERALLDAAQAMRSARLEQEEDHDVGTSAQERRGLSVARVTRVEPFGIGDRACVDLAGLLEPGEGMLVGSTAAHLALVHGETVPSAFVPTRPFRINAGAVHQYALLANGSTCYLSELSAGDEVLVVDAKGASRSLVVGRMKVERRPFISVTYTNEKGQEARVVLQNAETVRLVDARGTPMSVTTIEAGMSLIAWNDASGRHVGQAIESEVTEH